MKKLKNIIAVLMVITFSIMLYGCGKTPTNVVNEYSIPPSYTYRYKEKHQLMWLMSI